MRRNRLRNRVKGRARLVECMAAPGCVFLCPPSPVLAMLAALANPAGGSCDAMCMGTTDACTLSDRGHRDMYGTCSDVCHSAPCQTRTDTPEQCAEPESAWDAGRQSEGMSLKEWYFSSVKRRDVIKWHQYFRILIRAAPARVPASTASTAYSGDRNVQRRPSRSGRQL
jgi:hypothetical protein